MKLFARQNHFRHQKPTCGCPAVPYEGEQRALLSCDVSLDGLTVAAGTELRGEDALIVYWFVTHILFDILNAMTVFDCKISGTHDILPHRSENTPIPTQTT